MCYVEFRLGRLLTGLMACLLAGLFLKVLLPEGAHAAAPTINSEGQVGLTSYTKLPFASSVIAPSWGSSAGLSPANLFWQSGPHFTNTSIMAAALAASQGLTAQGLVPASGSQRWEDTYQASQPAGLFQVSQVGLLRTETVTAARRPNSKLGLSGSKRDRTCRSWLMMVAPCRFPTARGKEAGVTSAP